GYNPEGNDWEFVKLRPTPEGKTEILQAGKGEVANAIGSCQACHVRLAHDHDLVCEFVIGAAGLGLTDQQLAAIQAADPRCKKWRGRSEARGGGPPRIRREGAEVAGPHGGAEVLAQRRAARCDLPHDGADRAAHVDARALGCRGRLAAAPAEA